MRKNIDRGSKQMVAESRAKIITAPQKLTFREFLEQYPNDAICELINGEIVEIDATRAHKSIQYALIRKFDQECEISQLDYIIFI
jgi:hypothetical protein